MAPRVPRTDSGNITVTTVMVVIPLALLIVLALSAGAAYARWATLSSSLAAARETTMTAGFQMMLKSSSEPGRLIASKLASELRQAGVDDELTVWFAESQSASLGDTTRALAYYAILKTTYGEGTLFGAIEIPCATTASIVPYAATRVYKPSTGNAAEVYRFDESATEGTCAALTGGSLLPQPLSEALAEAEQRALTY